MSDSIFALWQSRLFWTVVSSWTVAQSAKVIGGVIRYRRFDFRWFVGTGGMPSAHAAGVTALAAGVGYSAGFQSTLFIVTAVFAFVIMFDAQGVRRAAGVQAALLNKIVEDIYMGREIPQERLRELIGHTPVEVFVGAGVGMSLAYTCFFLI